jgi:hypothetical protein
MPSGSVMMPSLHPFPARMAPELALRELGALPIGSTVLDPMAGSGTVLRQASSLGHRAIGFDVDPLAVLMSAVWTTPIFGDNARVVALSRSVLQDAIARRDDSIHLPWIDDDEETSAFVNYWFGQYQRAQLRRLALSLGSLPASGSGRTAHAANILRVALSKTIITKDRGASLARDVSHSRPHKVATSSTFDVFEAFQRSVTTVLRVLQAAPPPGNVRVQLGDARSLRPLVNRSIDAVMTSPPYLNAIDYIRGHRLALVWMGYRVSELRKIRSGSIGAERGLGTEATSKLFAEIEESMSQPGALSSRHAAMVARYARDLYAVMSEIARVLRREGRAILVVGDSCLKGTFIRNSKGVVCAARMVGLGLDRKVVRKLPLQRRYLPLPAGNDAPLGRRMRTESILSFRFT